MSGFFGVVTKQDCVSDLYYGTDYHSHLGTRRGGLATLDKGAFTRHIHDISNAQFRSKFSSNVANMHGSAGIGVISDYEDQPLIIGSNLGTYAIVTVGLVTNQAELINNVFSKRQVHFSHMNDGEVNPTELVAALINQGRTFQEGIRIAQECIEGSCSMLLLTDDGVYAARDRYGRTPILLGQKEGAYAASLESCALPNMGYEPFLNLGPGQIVLMTPDGIETLRPPDDEMYICSFLWIYYGFPASSYEGINVEESRYRAGALLSQRDTVQADYVAGIPDSGSGYGLGYSNHAGIPFKRPFVKYTSTWARSFIPPFQSMRNTVSKMKLIPVPDLIRDRHILFCDDSIVRGTQLHDSARLFYAHGARALHARVACPPLLFGCKYLNFSRSTSPLELIGRRVIHTMTGRDDDETAKTFTDPDSDNNIQMTEGIREKLKLTSLGFQRPADIVSAIGLPETSLCTYCWTGQERPSCKTPCPAHLKNNPPAGAKLP